MGLFQSVNLQSDSGRCKERTPKKFKILTSKSSSSLEYSGHRLISAPYFWSYQTVGPFIRGSFMYFYIKRPEKSGLRINRRLLYHHFVILEPCVRLMGMFFLWNGPLDFWHEIEICSSDECIKRWREERNKIPNFVCIQIYTVQCSAVLEDTFGYSAAALCKVNKSPKFIHNTE